MKQTVIFSASGERSWLLETVICRLHFHVTVAMCLNPYTVSGEALCLQGPSPDEVALAEGARQLGFEFVSRSSNGVVLNLQGTEVRCGNMQKPRARGKPACQSSALGAGLSNPLSDFTCMRD